MHQSLSVSDNARTAVLSTVGCFLALASITVWMWSATQKELRQAGQERFLFKVAESRDAVRQRLLAYEQVLRGGSAFITASRDLSRQSWRTYVDRLDLKQNFPGIQAMSYSPIIRRVSLYAYLQKMRGDGDPDFAIKPGGERHEYVPVTYIEPNDWRNRRALGFDLITEPVRREALVRARDSGSLAATGKITLKQETDQGVQSGFLMCAPLFPDGAAPSSLAMRRAQIVGYHCAVFRMKDLMRGIFGATALPDVRLEIFDGAATTAAAHQIYDSAEGTTASPTGLAAFVANRTFEFGGRTWALRVSSTPAFDATIDVQKPSLILFGGLLISALFAGVIWSSGQNRRRALEVAAANRGLEQLAADLERSKSAAEAASQAKGDFLANVSHELRTPLTLILAPLEQLSAAVTPPEDWTAHVARMRRNASQLLNRVNDILDFSKSDAGKLDTHWKRMHLADMLTPLINDAVAAAGTSGRTMYWSFDSAVGEVDADPRHLEKIVLNLVGNALKFTPEAEWIRVELKLHGTTHYEFSVTNSGPGIAAEQLSELFIRFHQLDTSATRHHGGTGIGLALVKQLTQSMGGEVGVESNFGSDVRFFVRLPLLRPAWAGTSPAEELPTCHADQFGSALRHARFAATGASTSMPASATAAPAEGVQGRVLVVDDDADMRAYVAELLTGQYVVTTAADGEQAWEILQQRPFDVLLSDVMMPGMDGLELTARIKTDPKLAKLPIIMVTARGGAEASSTGLACGADDYLAKPFSPRELKARVHAALRMAALQSSLRDASREAGMAMLASGILHNVGNLLCNISVSATLMHNLVRRSDVAQLTRVADLLRAAAQAPDASLPMDVADFVAELARRLQGEHATLLTESNSLRSGVEHASAIIAQQQDFAKPGRDLKELVTPSTLLDTALALTGSRLAHHGIEVVRSDESDTAALVDRYKTMQILLNLIGNAVDALESIPLSQRKLTIRSVRCDMHTRIDISDTGCGIDAHDLPLVFNQGFTTKGNGHGYGLHLSALWAHESGGALRCHSAGTGCGTTFTLELPHPPTHRASVPNLVAIQST